MLCSGRRHRREIKATAVAANNIMESITREQNRVCSHSRNEHDIATSDPTTGQFPWLADAMGNIVGSIARGRTKRNWGYVILRRNSQGEFEIWKLASGFCDWRKAEHQLMLAMDADEVHDCQRDAMGRSGVANKVAQQS